MNATKGNMKGPPACNSQRSRHCLPNAAMKLLLMLLYLIRNLSAQFPFLPPNINANFYQVDEMDYLSIPYAPRYQDTAYGHEPYSHHDFHYYDNYDYMDSEECRCSCSQCDIPKPCCRQMCMTSCNHPEVVLLSYPYPLVVSSPLSTTLETTTTKTTQGTTTPEQHTRTTTTEQTTTEQTTTEQTTTTASTTQAVTKRKPVNISDDARNMLAMLSPRIQPRKVVNDIHLDDFVVETPKNKGGDGKYILTSFRRTKTDKKPTYGILPIPGHLAERLMARLRHMKNIN